MKLEAYSSRCYLTIVCQLFVSYVIYYPDRITFKYMKTLFRKILTQQQLR
jgi:hypothetical protein